MESYRETRAGGFTPSWGRLDAPDWVPAPRAPSDIACTCETNDVATFRVEERSQGAVVVACGEIDLSTAPALHEAMLSASRASARVVLDLPDVTFLDSSGLAVLIAVLKSGAREPEAAPPRLVGPTLHVRKVLDITRLSERLPIHETLAEALDQAT